MKKNQSCPKLAEKARKLVGNNFRVLLTTYHPPPPHWGQTNLDKQIKRVPNWPKWIEKRLIITLNFYQNWGLKKMVK